MDNIAMGVTTPNINPQGFNQGVAAGQAAQINTVNIDQAKQQQYMQGLNTIAAGAAYAIDPKTGQTDPTKWSQVVDSVASSGADVAKFKNHPELAPMLVKLSLTTQQQIANAQTQQQIDMAINKYGLEVQQFLHPLPSANPPGTVFSDARTGQPLPGQSTDQGGPYGNSPDAWAMRVTRTGDPSTAEYAQAYNILAQPTITTVPDGHGGMMQMSVPRTLPQGTRPPTYRGQVQPVTAGGPQAAPAPSAAPPMGGSFNVRPNQLANVGQPDTAARIGQMQPQAGAQPPQTAAQPQPQNWAQPNDTTTMANGTTLTPITGLNAPPTEATIRSGLLSGSLTQLAPGILKYWNTMSDPTQLGLDAIKNSPVFGPILGPFANLLESGDYQVASSNMTGAIQEIVFQLSGANTAVFETINTKTPMVPVFGDKPQQLENKRQNFLAFIQNIADASQNPIYKERAQAILKEYASPESGGGTSSAASTPPPAVKPWDEYFKNSLPTGMRP